MWMLVNSGAHTEKNGEKMELTMPAIRDALSATGSTRVNRNLDPQFRSIESQLCSMTLDQPSESSSQAVVVSVHEEMAERAAPTEEAETVEAAMGTMGATAAVTLADNAVDSEELIMPIVVDFDCAVLATDGKATVDISRTGARSMLIREICELGLGQTSVEWTPDRDKKMASKSVIDLQV